MNLLASSIARLMFAVLTAAIGFTALRTQSEFWLGILVAIACAWALVALDSIVVGARKQGRPFWSAFLLAMLVSLALGFGPLSDRSIRRAAPSITRGADAYIKKVSSLSCGFLILLPFIRPCERTEAATFDDDGVQHTEITFTYHPGTPVSYEEQSLWLANSLKQDISFFSTMREGYPTHFTLLEYAPTVYLDAAYLILILLMGTIAGTIASVLSFFLRRRRSDHSHPAMIAPNSDTIIQSNSSNIFIRTEINSEQVKILEKAFDIPGVPLPIRLPEPNDLGLTRNSRQDGPDPSPRVDLSRPVSPMISHDDVGTESNLLPSFEPVWIDLQGILANQPPFSIGHGNLLFLAGWTNRFTGLN